MKLRPIGDKVLIEPVRVKDHNDHGIITPETWRPRPAVGFVAAISDEAKKETGLSTGDRVLLNQMAGTEIYDGRFLIYRAEEILGVA